MKHLGSPICVLPCLISVQVTLFHCFPENPSGVTNLLCFLVPMHLLSSEPAPGTSKRICSNSGENLTGRDQKVAEGLLICEGEGVLPSLTGLAVDLSQEGQGFLSWAAGME